MKNDHLEDDGTGDSRTDEQKARDAFLTSGPVLLVLTVASGLAKFLSCSAVHMRVPPECATIFLTWTALAGLAAWFLVVPLGRWLLRFSWKASALVVGAITVGAVIGHAVYLFRFMQ